MTVEQLDQQMKDFLHMVENGIKKLESENFESLDISGFIQVHYDLVCALDLKDEIFGDD